MLKLFYVFINVCVVLHSFEAYQLCDYCCVYLLLILSLVGYFWLLVLQQGTGVTHSQSLFIVYIQFSVGKLDVSWSTPYLTSL